MGNSKNSFTEGIAAAVDDCLARNVGVGQRVVVGLSGGIDSVVLLHALIGKVGRYQLRLGAVHVHHAISDNADTWESHCRDLCQAAEIPLAIARVEVERGSADGLEAAARRARHAAFAGIEADWIALAHHRDDQAETMLFNLLRGTGLAGAAGMAETNGRLLRPLLSVGRQDIAQYARSHSLVWVEDETNTDTTFSRNHLRHSVIAGLEERFPGCAANLAAASKRFAEARTLLDELALADLGGDGGFPVDVATLDALSEPRARNALRYLLQRRHIGIPSEERLREILRQLLHARTDRHPSALFGNWRIHRHAGKVWVEFQDDA